MTNTNDFRKYSYQYDTANLISAFNYTRGSQAAPKVKPEYEERERKLKVRNAKGIKSQPQLEREQKRSARSVMLIMFAAVACLLLIGTVINSFAVKNQLTRELATKQTEIANAQSEYISLQSQLNSMFSVSMIDKYAVEKLGMSKVRQGQVQYMDVSEFKKEAEKAKQNKPKDKKASAAAAAVAAAKGDSKKETKKETKKEKAEEEETPETFTPSADGEEVIND